MLCIEAELVYNYVGIDADERFCVTLNGQRNKEYVTVLSGSGGKSLMGLHVSYSYISDKTMVMVKCVDVRKYFAQYDWRPEQFVDEKKICDIQSMLESKSQRIAGNSTTH
jgi:KaiC/GvpD/RAD55 family RecA-like ATPase